ncbi:MAG: hypothetical protein ACT4OM_02955 [Actinomycetota bacterium]
MPTTRARHPVTETDLVAEILDIAQVRWPGIPRSRLIVSILRDWAGGGRSPTAQAAARRTLAGSLPGTSALYAPGGDWPE